MTSKFSHIQITLVTMATDRNPCVVRDCLSLSSLNGLKTETALYCYRSDTIPRAYGGSQKRKIHEAVS